MVNYTLPEKDQIEHISLANNEISQLTQIKSGKEIRQ
jgi:hypothetical protein